jgi:hypothetical protein
VLVILFLEFSIALVISFVNLSFIFVISLVRFSAILQGVCHDEHVLFEFRFQVHNGRIHCIG